MKGHCLCPVSLLGAGPHTIGCWWCCCCCAVCHAVHRTFVDKFKYALVWGTSAKHQPQRVGITHTLEDEDVVQLMTK